METKHLQSDDRARLPGRQNLSCWAHSRSAKRKLHGWRYVLLCIWHKAKDAGNYKNSFSTVRPNLKSNPNLCVFRSNGKLSCLMPVTSHRQQHSRYSIPSGNQDHDLHLSWHSPKLRSIQAAQPAVRSSVHWGLPPSLTPCHQNPLCFPDGPLPVFTFAVFCFPLDPTDEHLRLVFLSVAPVSSISLWQLLILSRLYMCCIL